MAEPTYRAEGQGPERPDMAGPRPSALGPSSARLRALGGILLLGAMGGGVWLFGYWEPRLLPVRVIEVQGELHHHSSELLQKTIGERLSGGILTADLADLKQAAEGLPWVGRASLRRVWPDRLQVRVDEHKPAARWGRDGLVTAEGLVFHPRTGTVPAGLPVLEGDEKRSRELVSRYLKWRDDLMLAGQLIDTVSLDARGAWRLDLVSGTRVELGTNQVEERLARFIGAVAQLDAAGRAEVVDMRYGNGFAVKWAHTPAPADPSATETPAAEAPKTASARPTGAVAGHKVASTKSTKTARPLKGAKIAKSATPARSAKASAPAKAAKPPKARAAGPARTLAAAKPAAAPAASSATRPATAKTAAAKAAPPVKSTRGAPVEERSMKPGKPTERKLQAQAERRAADRNL